MFHSRISPAKHPLNRQQAYSKFETFNEVSTSFTCKYNVHFQKFYSTKVYISLNALLIRS